MSKTEYVFNALRELCEEHQVVIQGFRLEDATHRTLLMDGSDLSMGPGADDPQKIDLAVMHAKSDEIRRSAFLGLAEAVRTPVEHLKHLGHKTVSDAVVARFQYYASQLDQLLKNYLERYPE